MDSTMGSVTKRLRTHGRQSHRRQAELSCLRMRWHSHSHSDSVRLCHTVLQLCLRPIPPRSVRRDVILRQSSLLRMASRRAGYLLPAQFSAAAVQRLTKWNARTGQKPRPEEQLDYHLAFHDMLYLSLLPGAAEEPGPGPSAVPSLVVQGVGRIEHCIRSGYLADTSPDFSLFSKYHSRGPVACVLNIELQLDALDPIHKQRALT